ERMERPVAGRQRRPRPLQAGIHGPRPALVPDPSQETSLMRTALTAIALVVAAAAASAEPATFAIDPNHTVVTFEALHLNTSTQRGRIQAKEGSVVLDRAAKTGKVDVTVDVATVSVAAQALENVLKGERAFNVAQNPTAR